jgi:integrase
MNRVDAYRLVRRRTAEAGFKVKARFHVFRATGITAYLEAGGTLENAWRHRNPAHNQTVRPHRRRDHARRGRKDYDLKLLTPFGVAATAGRRCG